MTGSDDHLREMRDEELIQMVGRLAEGPAFVPGPELALLLDAGLHADNGTLPATAVRKANGPAATQVAGLPTWRKNRMIIKVAAAVAAGFVGMGSLGVAGALPASIQNTVASVADVVGVDIPDDGDGNGAADDGSELVLFTEDTDTPNAEPEPETDPPADKPENFGDVVHDAKANGATGQDIADLAHERNEARREERGNPGRGHDKQDEQSAKHDKPAKDHADDDDDSDEAPEVEEPEAPETEDGEDEDEEATIEADESDEAPKPEKDNGGRGRGHDK